MLPYSTHHFSHNRLGSFGHTVGSVDRPQAASLHEYPAVEITKFEHRIPHVQTKEALDRIGPRRHSQHAGLSSSRYKLAAQLRDRAEREWTLTRRRSRKRW
jgi:hypothetical protein